MLHEMLPNPSSKPMLPLLGGGDYDREGMEKVNNCQKELWEGLRSDTLEGSPSLVLFAELVTYSLPELLPATVFYGAMSFQPG